MNQFPEKDVLKEPMVETAPEDNFSVVIENDNGKEIVDYLVSKGFNNEHDYKGWLTNGSYYYVRNKVIVGGRHGHEDLKSYTLNQLKSLNIKQDMNNKFKVGDLVMISKSSSWYGFDSTRNPQDIKGKIVKIFGGDVSLLPYKVEWSNGGNNTYEASDLIKVEDVKEKSIHDILVERSTLEVGDIVIVTHKVPNYDLGWNCSWMGSMYDAIGKECIVTESPKDSGVRLGGQGGNFLYPLQSVQLVRKGHKKINVHISEDYIAVVTEKDIKINDQVITFEDFDDLVKAVAKMRKQ